MLQVDCYPFGDPFKRDLIFFAIPNRGIGPVAGGVAVEPSMNTPSQEMLSDTSGSQPEVLAGITKLVDSPKGGIPSLVRLESPKERLDYRGQILTGAFNGIVDVMNVGREGEFDVLEARVITQDSRSISSLVESRTKIIDGIEQDESKFFGWAGSEPDLVNFVDSIWVFLDHMGPRLGIDVGQDSKVKILNVVMCSPEHETWISKRVTHDKET